MSVEKLKSGIFLVIEGQDGVGKSTQTKILVERLKADGYDVVQTREVGGTEFGEVMREQLLTRDLTPVTEVLTTIAARADHYDKVVKPALLDNKVVISDRGMLSTWAYNVFPHIVDLGTEDANANKLASLFTFASNAIRLEVEPVTLILNAPYATVKENYSGAERDDYERDLKRMDHAATAYSSTADSVNTNDNTLKVIDAVGTIDEVSERIYDVAINCIKQRSMIDFPELDEEVEVETPSLELAEEPVAAPDVEEPVSLEEQKAKALQEMLDILEERSKDIGEGKKLYTPEALELVVGWYKKSIDLHVTSELQLQSVHQWAASVAVNSLLSYNFFLGLEAGKE